MDIAKTSLQLVALEERPRPRCPEEALGRSEGRMRGKMPVPAHQLDQRPRYRVDALFPGPFDFEDRAPDQ